MKSLRKIILLIVVILALAGTGLLQWFNLLAAQHRDQVHQELQKILGQDSSFASLEVRLLGRTGFVAKDLRIADDSRFAATPLLRTEEFILGVSLWNLLFRRLVITSLTFNDPELQVITDESGQLNLTALMGRKTEFRNFPRLRPGAPERRPPPVSFAVDEIRIERGRIDYLDRSVKEPAELRLRNISLKVQGFAPAQTIQLRLVAALTEGLGQDLQIDGRFTPPPKNSSWIHRGVDLNLRFDSLRVPVVARAIAAVRDKIPSDLDVTGPMALQAKAGGTLVRPRFDDIVLKVPLFGSSDYNAAVTGSVHFTEQRTWEDAQLRGELAIEPLTLARLRNLKFLAQNLPSDLGADGTVDIYSRFEGTWQTLRLGTLVRADKAALDYGRWFRKTADSPATIRTQISRNEQRLVFHESEIILGANRIGFSGDVDFNSAPQLRVKLRSKNASLPAWSKYFVPPLLAGASGSFDLDLSVAKRLAPGDGDWSMTGELRLADAGLKHSVGAHHVEDLHAQVAFIGKGARLYGARFRLGRAHFALDGTVANLLEPRLAYSLRSPGVELGDLPLLVATPPMRFKNINGVGEIYLDKGQWRLSGSIASPEGDLNSFPYSDLRADIDLSAGGVGFKNVWARTMNGLFRAEGFLSAANGQAQQLKFTAQIDGVALPALIGHLLPPLRDRVDGQLDGRGRFRITSADDGESKGALQGSFETSIQRGVIRDFNLLSQLLLRGSGATVSAASMSRLPPGFAGLLSRSHTPFDSLKATFTIDQKRIATDNLVIATPDYTVTGAGWIGFDRSTNWNGSIVLSPRLTQEVQRDYRMIRYLLDRRGRLPIAFRAEGRIPRVAIRLENRALAQLLRGGAAASGGLDSAGAAKVKENKRWLPDALERFLNR